MKGAQVGATESGNCWIGYVIHQAPGPMMAVAPTVELAKRNSKQRLDPLIEESEVLRERVKERRSPGQRQYRALQGVPGRGADPDRRQQRGRAALDAGALPVPGRGRRLPGRRRGRGRSDPARGAAVGDLPAAQDPAGLDAQDQGPVADRAGVRAERPAPVLRALPALPRASDAGASEPPLAGGPAAGGGVCLRQLRQPDRRAAQDLDAGARRVAAHRSRAMAGPPASTSPASTARSGGSAGPMPRRCTSRPGRRPT